MTSKLSYSSASLHRRGNTGFALTISIGVGLFLIIVAATVILRSHQQQVTAIAQKQTAGSLSAAEVGISRIQNLLARHRAASLYSACTTWSGETCADSGTPPITPPITWKNASAIAGLSTNCTGGSTAINDVKNTATRTWQPIDTADAAKGEYRLLNYTYPNPGLPNSEGTLTVQGRAGTASGSLSAVTQLSVKIPVQAASPNVPGLWVQGNVTTGTIKANILGKCSSTITASPETGFSISKNDSPMPDIPTESASAISLASVSGLTLPQSTDSINSGTGTYQYIVPTINDSFTITPGKKVEIWVQGNIELDGTKTIQHQCGAVAGCSPFDAKIYGVSKAASVLFNLSGDTAVCDVFFHAPTYNVEMNGGGSAKNCGGIANNNGIYWVKSWTGGGQGAHIALDQTLAIWSDQPFPPALQPPTLLKPITSWQREEAATL